MYKMLILMCVLVFALGSLGGYLFLTEKIIAGNIKIAAGQKQIEQGEQMLKNGKSKLAKGKQELSGFKHVNSAIQSIPFMGFADNLPIGGDILNMGNKKISEEGQLISKGQEKIKAGEAELASGKTELSAGIERLNKANVIRIVYAVGAILFTSLFIGLGIYWGRIAIRLRSDIKKREIKKN